MYSYQDRIKAVRLDAGQTSGSHLPSVGVQANACSTQALPVAHVGECRATSDEAGPEPDLPAT